MKRSIFFLLLFTLPLFSSEICSFISIPEGEDALAPLIIESIILSNKRSGTDEGSVLFDLQQIEHQLHQIPAIEKARVVQMGSGELAIYHTMRKPILSLQKKEKSGLFSPVYGCDKTGFCFPMDPWYSPKRLPLLLIEEEALEKSGYIVEEIIPFIETVNSALKNSCSIVSIDMTKMGCHFCYFQREVVLSIELSPLKYTKEATLLIRIHPSQMKKKVTIELPKVFSYLIDNLQSGEKRCGVLDMRYPDFCLFYTVE